MWIVYLLMMVGVYAPVLGLSFVLARWAARRLCDNPRGRAAGTLGGVLGAWLGCFEVIDLASKMGWFRESGEWVVGLIRGGLYALVLGLPIGLCVGVCIGLAVWKAATGGREVRIGLLLGLAFGGVLAGPVILLVPQQYFELVNGGGMTNIIVLIVLLGGAVGAHAGYALSRNANAPRRAGLNAALLCIAAGAILTAIMFPSIRTHTQSSTQLAKLETPRR